MGMGASFDARALDLVCRYEKGGRRLEETLQANWWALTFGMQGQVVGGTWSVGDLVSLRGPVGTDYTSDPELLAVLRSLRRDPAWEAEMSRHFAKMAAIRHRGNMARRNQAFQAHQQRMQSMQHTSDLMFEGWKRRSAIDDASHSRRIQAIHGVQSYALPSGEQVELPSVYDHVYTDGDGRYLLGDDATFDPNTVAGEAGRWTRIEPARR